MPRFGQGFLKNADESEENIRLRAPEKQFKPWNKPRGEEPKPKESRSSKSGCQQSDHKDKKICTTVVETIDPQPFTSKAMKVGNAKSLQVQEQ